MTVPYKGGTHIRVGRLYNNSAVPEDMIRLQVRSAFGGGSHIDHSFTLDEAATVAAGLSYVVASALGTDAEHVRERYR